MNPLIPQAIEESPEWTKLYDAHVLFIKELAIVRQCFDIYRVVLINQNVKGTGAEFIRFSAMLAQRNFVTGLESLFERTNGGEGLCSIRGLLTLANDLPLKNPSAHTEFVEKYGIQATSSWSNDVEKILKSERKMVQACLTRTSTIRNKRLAHLEQPSPNEGQATLPNLDESEKIIAFAYNFYLFIARGFLNSYGADLPAGAGHSLLQLLRKRFDFVNARFDLPPDKIPL
jgi:hypothetical protein